MSPPSSRSKSYPRRALIATCFHVGFLLWLFFNPEDGGDTFPWNGLHGVILHKIVRLTWSLPSSLQHLDKRFIDQKCLMFHHLPQTLFRSTCALKIGPLLRFLCPVSKRFVLMCHHLALISWCLDLTSRQISIKNKMGGCGLKLSGSQLDPMMRCSERGNEIMGSIKCGESLNWSSIGLSTRRRPRGGMLLMNVRHCEWGTSKTD
jgi:hypothetical protein